MAGRAGRDFTHHRHLVTGVTKEGDNADGNPGGHTAGANLASKTPVTTITIRGDFDYTRARSFAFECSHCWWGNAIQFRVQFGGACLVLQGAESLRLYPFSG